MVNTINPATTTKIAPVMTNDRQRDALLRRRRAGHGPEHVVTRCSFTPGTCTCRNAKIALNTRLNLSSPTRKYLLYRVCNSVQTADPMRVDVVSLAGAVTRMSLRIDEKQSQGITYPIAEWARRAGARIRAVCRVLSTRYRQTVRLVIDLAEVSFIDSTGLGVLVAEHSRLARAGGAMRLLHASKKHIQLLVLTKLTTIFQLFDDQADAVDSFYPDRERKQFDILEFVKRPEPDDPVR